MSSRRRVRLASCRVPSESCSGRSWVSTSREKNWSASASIPRRQAYPRHQQDPADEPVVDDQASDQAEEGTEQDDERADRGIPFRRRHRLYGPIVLYGGRVEPDNGCEEMLEYFDTYAASDGDTSLVLMGVKMMKVPDEPYVRQAGVLPDRERMVAYEAADVTIAPGLG